MLVAASVQDSSASTACGVVALTLFVVGLVVTVSGFIIGEDLWIAIVRGWCGYGVGC